MKVVRLRRRRDGLHLPETMRTERDALRRLVDRESKDRKLQLMAYGAKIALEWACDNQNDMKPSRMLDLTEFALKFQKRRPLKLVPVLKKRT